MPSDAFFFSSSQPVPPVPASQLSVTSNSSVTKEYRPVRPLPYELRDHTNVYIEEELYSQAISLLLNTLIAGNDGTSDGRLLPAYIPPPQVLAVIATLAVHPNWTNRASDPSKPKVANEALFLLQHVNTIVGPVNANFSSAFQFLNGSGRRERRRRTGDIVLDGDDETKFQVEPATKGAIWNRAEDLWSVVGWAFNCSSRHPKRWERWRGWLQFMLNVLEDDLQDKIAASKAPEAEGKQAMVNTILSESLIAQYLTNLVDGRSGKRRVMRAILADGSKKSLDEFGEIWKDETKPPKKQKQDEPAERKKINFDENEYGDYMDEDDEDDDSISSPKTSAPTRTSTRKRGRPQSATPASDGESTTAEDGPQDYGGPESVQLRKRFMALLTEISHVYEHAFLELEDCFDLLTEFIRPLPLSIFNQFVLPAAPYLEPHFQASLCQNLLRPIISSEAPVYHAETMTQLEFERHFLPYPANYTNFVENARVSMLVESLLRLLCRHGVLRVTDGLKEKLEEGIKAREAKAKFGARKLVGVKEAEEEKAIKLLEFSTMRMRALVKAAGART